MGEISILQSHTNNHPSIGLVEKPPDGYEALDNGEK